MILDEHFSYISDSVRTGRFRQAIARTVRQGDVVADLGCGFGVLGMLCLQSGAAHCWGIDQTDAIEIARETMARAGLGERYSCIHELSYRARLPEPVDLIICDHVGYFGLDYGIVGMVADARRRFLKTGGTIMPSRIKLFLAAASSQECRSKVDGWLSDSIPSEFNWLQEYSVNTKQGRIFKPDEICTSPVELQTIDLRVDNPEYFSFDAVLEVTRDGTIDGLLGWFDCELTDSIWMTNSPLDAKAIDRDQAFLPFATPIKAKRGTVIEANVKIRPDSGMIAWSIHIPETGQRLRQSTWQSFVVNRAALGNADDEIAKLDRLGAARQAIFKYVDGHRTKHEIATAFASDHPELFPSQAEILRFVIQELARNTRS